MIVIFPASVFYPIYIKKEDTREYVINHRKMGGLALMFLAFLLGLMQYILLPRVFELFNDLSVGIPTSMIIAIISSIIFMIVSIAFGGYLLFTQPNFQKLNKILNKYKSNSMIRSREVMDTKITIPIVLLFVAMIILICYSTILPIYNIVKQF